MLETVFCGKLSVLVADELGAIVVWQIAGTPYLAKWHFVFSMTVEDRVSSSLSTSIQSEK